MVPLYNWAISKGYFIPKTEYQKNTKAKENFNSAYLEHDHYTDEILDE